MEVDKMISTGEKAPEIKPDYTPPPLLTTDKIFKNTTKKNEDFIQTSLTIRDDEIKAEKEIADQKTKNLIKQILNPTPGYFVDDEFNLKDSNVNDKKITDNPFVLKPEVQKQLNDTVLKKFISPPAVEPMLAKSNQDAFDPPSFSILPPLPEPSIPNIVEPTPPDKTFIPPTVPESPPLLYEPPPPYEDPPPYIPLEDIFIDDEVVD